MAHRVEDTSDLIAVSDDKILGPVADMVVGDEKRTEQFIEQTVAVMLPLTFQASLAQPGHVLLIRRRSGSHVVFRGSIESTGVQVAGESWVKIDATAFSKLS